MLQLRDDAAKNKLTHIFIKKKKKKTGFRSSLEDIHSGSKTMEISF